MEPTWSNGESSELERRLLEAAKHDRVPDALSARMAEGLGLHATGAALGGLGTGGKLGALFVKAGLWGVLSLALVPAVTGWPAAQPAPRADRAPRVVPPAPSVAEAVVALPRAAPPETSPAPRPLAAPPPAARAAVSDDAALRAEIALLDRARNALREGAGARALRLLDQHRKRFARASLAPEAAALRIEALVQRGAYAQAESMSQAFVAAYPAHPLTERVAVLRLQSRPGGLQPKK